MPAKLTMPLHLIAETTPGMHPWETLPGTYDDSGDALDAAEEYAAQHDCEVHVNDARGNLYLRVGDL
jgi:hypothetical protein